VLRFAEGWWGVNHHEGADWTVRNAGLLPDVAFTAL
jgi:hypothetical protein